jgi:hypothetical protein
MAQEAIFVEGILAMPADDLRINLGHDLEFKQKYNAIPKGKYSSFDTLRVSMAPQPIIASKFVRAHLMPRSPYADMVRDIFRASGRTDYETSSDFLFEIHAVNTTDNVTTIQKMVAEAEIGGKWVQLPLLDDLSNYQLVFDDSKTSTQGGKSFTTKDERVEELNSFWEKIKGVPFNRGIGYQGWVGFELTTQSAELSKPVMHKVRLIDAFGGTHPVVNIEPPDTKGRLQHSPKAYNS